MKVVYIYELGTDMKCDLAVTWSLHVVNLLLLGSVKLTSIEHLWDYKIFIYTSQLSRVFIEGSFCSVLNH